MAETISKFLLGYCVVVAVALLVILAWGRIGGRLLARRRRRLARREKRARETSATEPEPVPVSPAEVEARPRDNVDRFRRDR